MSLFAKNRQRLCERLRSKLGEQHAIVLLRGGEQPTIYDTDGETAFRQESFFHWCFGVKEGSFCGAINVRTGEATLFAPLLDEIYAVWMGPLPSTEDIRAKYQVEHCVLANQETNWSDVTTWLKAQDPATVLLTLHGVNTDGHKPTLAFDQSFCPSLSETGFKIDKETLWPEISDLRSIKTAEEIEVMRYVCRVSAEAHNLLLQRARPGMTEFQLESLFLHFVYAVGGCRHVGYTCISCSGPNGAILHYGHAGAPNDRTFKDGDMMMLDMGGAYACYTADISCSWPANGTFTPVQKAVYDAVAHAQEAVYAEMKPGASWPDLHRAAEAVLLKALQSAPLNVIKADADLAELHRLRLPAFFMPHGMGHLLGIDVHDAGGYLPHTPARSTEPGLRSLRTARVLEAGMILTVEPGLYFIDALIDKLLADPVLSPFINADNLNNLRGFGGVRLEDDVLVTETGCDNLSALCPRTTEAVEQLMAEGRAKYPEPFVDIRTAFF